MPTNNAVPTSDDQNRGTDKQDLAKKHIVAGDGVEIASRKQRRRYELAEERQRRRIERNDRHVAESQEPSAHEGVVTPGGIVGMCIFCAGDREFLDHHPVALDDEKHQGGTDDDADDRSNRSRSSKKVTRQNETSEPDDAAERQRQDLDRVE